MSKLLLPSKDLVDTSGQSLSSNPKGTRRKSNPSKLSAIRNPDGIWINSKQFSPAAEHFKKHGYYCGDRWGTPGWFEYWTEEARRCEEGYMVGGAMITGHHYNYLNYSPIQKLDKNGLTIGGAASKVTGFPDFYDGDYNYFHALDIARKGCTAEYYSDLRLEVKILPEHLIGNKHMMVGKARRKGYSFKNGSICANNYNHKRGSLSLIGAYDKSYLYGKGKGTMVMASNYLNFLNEHTGWRKSRDFVDKQDNRKASYKKDIDGVTIEAGFLSEIIAITFKDNPDAARGKDPLLALLEEVGAWPGFKDAWSALAPSLMAGKYMTGQMIAFGTGGDMASGTADFADMYYHPDLYNIMPFENIWDEDAEGTTCGFFHPMQWNRDGYIDDEGNSLIKEALEDEAKLREEMRKKSSASSLVLQGRMQEEPTCPAEAFLTVSSNSFPVVELRKRLNVVQRERLDHVLGQAVTLYRDEENKVKVSPDLEEKLSPIYKRKPETKDLSGACIMYEHPIANTPFGMYRIGFDPVAQDDGTSLSSITVMKGNQKFSATSGTIVFRYIGRGRDADDTSALFLDICELYNTPGMHENMVLHVKTYFKRRYKTQWLASQPDQLISKSIKDSSVNRNFGCHMDEKLKDTGEQLVKKWLLRVIGHREDGSKILMLETITDEGLLDELIAYDRKKGNFDRVMSLMMALFQDEEDDLERTYEAEEENKSDLSELAGRLFKRN